jgi:nuclear inhibitor of protein phosphatase 1
MIDERKMYMFGRVNKEVDITIEHASCSRYHAALFYHDQMDRYFLVDLGSSWLNLKSSIDVFYFFSAHGTFIGNTKLTQFLLTQCPFDTLFHFGASTRRYFFI